MTRTWPNASTVIPEVTAEFGGAHELTGYHRGIDLIGYTWNCAADDGVVTFAGNNGTAGYEVKVRHDDGYITRYLHNEKGSLTVRRGDRVTRGQRLGRLGDTGFSSGSHCHFEVIAPDGTTRINPRDYIAAGQPASNDSRPFEEDDMFSDEDRQLLHAIATRDIPHTAAPINFRSTTGGVSYTMIPGIQIIRHENEIAAALTLEFVTGEKYPGAGATQQQREAIGERQINDAEILVMLAKFGFGWASRDINRLPDAGEVLYSDYIMRLLGQDVSR